MSKHTEQNPDMPPLTSDIEGNHDAEFVWQAWRNVWRENARLAALLQRERDKNYLLRLRYRRLVHAYKRLFKKEQL